MGATKGFTEDALPLTPGTGPSRRAQGLICLSSCPAPPFAAQGLLPHAPIRWEGAVAAGPCQTGAVQTSHFSALPPPRLCGAGHALAEHPDQRLPSCPHISVRPRQHLLAGKRVWVLGSPSPFLRTAPTRGESTVLGHQAQLKAPSSSLRRVPWGVPHPLSLVPSCRGRTAHGTGM